MQEVPCLTFKGQADAEERHKDALWFVHPFRKTAVKKHLYQQILPGDFIQ